MSVILETTEGDITVDLYIKERPRCSLNFLKLCKVKYYNFSLFHTIERNFIAQGGDPEGTGKGGESIYGKLYGDQARFFEAELLPKMRHIKKGTISMVNNGEGMHGSQFFITMDENLDYLDSGHTVFGEVVEGFDALDKINLAVCDKENKPYKDIRLSHTVILNDPFDDPSGLEVPDRSPELTAEQKKSNRIGADEQIDENEGLPLEEIEEKIKDKEAKARAAILEMVGDLPDADCAPPENVLFVCKLNPVTADQDLEIIFSRFGKIINCEVIRDKKSGESLQYAFIEFDKEEECENAYFKMDNVLIDDRRIHVDFSQSVSKIKWKGKGRGVEVIGDGKIDYRRKGKDAGRNARHRPEKNTLDEKLKSLISLKMKKPSRKHTASEEDASDSDSNRRGDKRKSGRRPSDCESHRRHKKMSVDSSEDDSRRKRHRRKSSAEPSDSEDRRRSHHRRPREAGSRRRRSSSHERDARSGRHKPANHNRRRD